MNPTTTPLVSVCMPAYNAAHFVGEAIQSVLDQTYPNIEIIVVNDGSTDDTARVLAPFVQKGVTVIHQENRGQCAAANTAYRHSRGAYIKFFDADDLLSPGFIASQVEKLNGRRDAVASAAWGRFYQNDTRTFQLNPEAVWKDLPSLEWLLTSLESGHNMMQCGLWLIPREVLDAAGLWDERLSLINDFDFFIRILLQAEAVLFTEGATLYYRTGNESLSGQKSRKAMESAFLSTKRGVETILEKENSLRTRKVCADAFQFWAYEFYPQQLDLYELAQEQIAQLGGSHFPFPVGGKSKLLAQVIGWKNTKRLQMAFTKKR